MMRFTDLHVDEADHGRGTAADFDETSVVVRSLRHRYLGKAKYASSSGRSRPSCLTMVRYSRCQRRTKMR